VFLFFTFCAVFDEGSFNYVSVDCFSLYLSFSVTKGRVKPYFKFFIFFQLLFSRFYLESLKINSLVNGKLIVWKLFRYNNGLSYKQKKSGRFLYINTFGVGMKVQEILLEEK